MCDHGVKRAYKAQMKKSGQVGHLFECVAVKYPEPGQCPAQWINKPTEVK